MVRRRAAALVLAALSAAACDASFDDPAIVVDLRILGMQAEPPEIVIPYDPDDPTAVDIDDLGAVEVCALVADPGATRGLSYRMKVCPPTGSGRCASRDREGNQVPTIELEGGAVEDPERAGAPVRMCSTIEASLDLALVLQASVRADDLAGFGGVSAQVELRVTPEDGGDEEVVGFKRVRYSPELPAGRVANRNPSLDGVTVARAPSVVRGQDFEMPLGRCGQIEPWPVAPGERVMLLPRETAGSREDYLIPTFDGGSRSYTENLRYQWLATAGKFSRRNSGGELDSVGNAPPLDSRWTAPDDPAEIGDGLEVRLWIIQRDERGGQSWVESCVRVVP
jgi:hypothetical protein